MPSGTSFSFTGHPQRRQFSENNVFRDYNHFIPWEHPDALEAAIRMATDRLSRTRAKSVKGFALIPDQSSRNTKREKTN